jgi:hypothetical protein
VQQPLLQSLYHWPTGTKQRTENTMNYTTLYTAVTIARAITLKVAKVLVLILSMQLAILYLLASVSDASLTSLISPLLRVLVVIAVVILAPRVFDAILRRIVQASRNAS